MVLSRARAFRPSRALSLRQFVPHQWVQCVSITGEANACQNASHSHTELSRNPKLYSESNGGSARQPHTPLSSNIDGRSYTVNSASSTMRAAVLWEANGDMSIELMQMPRPQAGEVLVKVKACGVCHTDLHVIKAEQAFPFPCVLGHEVTGEVVEHGPNTDPGTVRRVPVGCKVVGAFIMPCGGCFFCTQGNEDLCSTFFEYNRGKGALYDGHTRLFRASNGQPVSQYSMGGLAEYCVLPATAVTPLPDSLPYAESAIMGCAVFTAYGAIRNAADVRAGESVAVIGTGGVGSSCIQMARAFGSSRVIAVDVNEKKLERMRELGATHTVNASTEDVVERIKELTGGRGVDVAVEALGKAATFLQGVLAVRDGGRAVMVGIAPTGVTAAIDITRIVRRNISIIGSYGAKARKDLPTLVRLAEEKQINIASAVSESHPLESAGATYKALDRGEIVGRAIVDMDL